MNKNKQLIDFIEKERVSVLGILQKNNTIHSSTLHFAYDENSFTFYFVTEKDSKKCESLKNSPQNASLVMGFDEKEFSTFQSEGKAKIVYDEKAWDIFIAKFPKRADLKADDEVVMLEFVPSWWRFSNLKTETEISSEN